MSMKLHSIRTKLALLLFLIALIPLLIVIVFFIIQNVTSSLSSSISDGQLRNTVVSEHITEYFERNFAVLRTVASSPMIYHYIEASAEKRDPLTAQMVRKIDSFFKDKNNMIITDAAGRQVFRTDSYSLVNVDARRYFKEAMAGREYVSGLLESLVNGRLITVVEVPVFGEDGRPVGMMQRDYDLAELQEFVANLAGGSAQVLVTDGEGNLLAHSGLSMAGNEVINIVQNPAVAAALAGKSSSEVVDGTLQEGRFLVSYTRNKLTGWVVLSARDYDSIWRNILSEAALAGSIGFFLLIVVALSAAIISERATRKIRTVSRLASKSAEDAVDSLSLSELGDDELGQMAIAINKIRSARDSYRKDAEVDKLTNLLNKATFERLSRMRLAGSGSGSYSALLVIDLDHFKEVNDTRGHLAGDTVLHEFAAALKKLFRPDDYIGRFGGDEFVILLGELPGKEIVLQKARRILEAAAALQLDGRVAGITASIGIAATPQHGADYDSLFAMADRSVYKVKNSGRSGCCYGEEAVIRLPPA